MRHVKSERLKKLETELLDLEQWLKLGLVPKKDVPKHKEEIQSLQAKIEEEKERLQFLRENDEGEEFVAPKRVPPKNAYADMPTIPDIDMPEGSTGFGETTFEMDTEAVEAEATEEEKGENEEEEEEVEEGEEEGEGEEESYFSERNRWRRGGIIDPDADDW